MLIEDKIEIIPYDPNWPKMAEQEIKQLKNIFSNNACGVIDIQHIGSTSIPKLAAKPIIDIYIGVASIKQAYEAIKLIENLGYQFWDKNPNKEKMFFVKGMPPLGKGRTHHIHIVEYGTNYWRARILFRDYMRSHPEEHKPYEKLKLDSMDKYPLDRESYTDNKMSFVENILKKAGFDEKVLR